MSLYNVISEKVVLPLSDLLTSQKVYKYFKLLQKSQYWDRKQIDDYQNEKLKFLIKHSYNTVPYYKDLFDKIGLKPEEIKTKEDLVKIPITSKEVIKREGIERFTSLRYPVKKIMNSSSSGSTGAPLFYLNTIDSYSMNIAAGLRGWYWAGYRLGDKFIKLSQNERNSSLKKIQDKVSRNLYLKTDPLTDDNFLSILKKFEQYQPKVIRCYPDPLLLLARFKKQNKKFTYSPLAITTTGNTLFPEVRKEIEEAFNCKIFDAYSCEGNAGVFECPTHEGYHSTEEYGISEILDENNNIIKSGVGRLISTDLHNLAHPFIRYDTQDLIEVNEEMCSCGRELLKINRIIGRDNDILEMSSGRKFIVHNFTGFFQVDTPELCRSINNFQVVKNKDYVVFKLVVNSNFNANVASYIKNYWESEFLLPVFVEVVDEIPLVASNKRRFIINE
jgi:phenylacetate-CoA ligase